MRERQTNDATTLPVRAWQHSPMKAVYESVALVEAAHVRTNRFAATANAETPFAPGHSGIRRTPRCGVRTQLHGQRPTHRRGIRDRRCAKFHTSLEACFVGELVSV